MLSQAATASNGSLHAYLKKLTASERLEGFENQRHERLEVHHAIGWRTKQKDTEGQR